MPKLIVYSLSISFFIFLISFYICKYKKLFIDDPNKKKHAIHKNIVPRCGGIPIYISFNILSIIYKVTINIFISLAYLPSFIIGIIEDLTQKVPQKYRLISFFISGLLFSILTGYYLPYIDLIFIKLPLFKVLAIIFTAFAITGIASAINLIDGLNGLASGVSLIASFSFLYVAFQLQDIFLIKALGLFIISIIPFFIFNFPLGKVFLGDTGAYFLGFALACYSIILVNRHTEVSHYYPFSVLAYPIVETFVTIYRRYKRKKEKGINFWISEKEHLHTMLRILSEKNSLSSLLILAIYSIFVILSTIFYKNKIILVVLTLIQILLYLAAYSNLRKKLRL